MGGRSGRVIGEKLWALSANRQVLCITHLPQVACFGDVHWYIEKRVERRDSTERTVTTVKRLSEA
ncbi:MAG: DNA repair protein RecN, partial [Chloroflexota bacterium]